MTILVGMAIWAVAMVVTGVLAAVDVVAWRVPTVCAAGLGLGVVALAWERKHRIEYRGD